METLVQKLNTKIRLNYHSIREAALQMGVDQSMLSQISKGQRPISAQYAIKIAPYVDISPREALSLAGHDDLVALLSADIPPPRTLTESRILYGEDAEVKEITILIRKLTPRDKRIAINILRTFVTTATTEELKL